MAILRHATPSRNLNSILRRGLLRSRSRGKLSVVWLHAPGKTAWALLHTVKRHGGPVEAVVVLLVDVPRSWLRRSKKGLWYSIKDIPAERIRGVLSFAELAGTSAEA
jgi:hypothetical protein